MFTREYLILADELGVTAREPASSPSLIKRTQESSVVKAWMTQPWDSHPLRLTGGGLVWILSPGWMRGGGGPDFTRAKVRLEDGRELEGDVEIHVRASDWERHGHHLDPAYDNVILSVVADLDLTQPRRTRQGNIPLELELNTAFPAWRETLRLEGEADPSELGGNPEPGACAAHLARIGPAGAMDLLDAAGEGRLILKSEKLAREMASSSGGQTLYRGLMEVLGYSRFRRQFIMLAANLPLDLLRGMVEGMDRLARPVALQSVFLGMAGLLPETGSRDDEETEGYVSRTHEAWLALREAFSLRPVLTRKEWKLSGVRPANYPMGRLAGISHFLAGNLEGGLETLMERILWSFPAEGPRREKQKWLENVSGMFAPSSVPDYWQLRHVAGSARLAAPRALVGTDRALLFMINIVVPFLLARAMAGGRGGEEGRLRAIAHSLPRPAANGITRHMERRLFPGKPPRGALDAARDQGILQIYADFCQGGACDGCPMAAYLARSRG